MEPFLRHDPRLAFRPVDSYLGIDLGLAQRTRIVLDTFRFVHAYGGVLKEALGSEEGMALTDLKLDKGFDLVVQLCSHSQFRKEGEVSVFIHLRPIEGCVASFAFSLEEADGGWNMRVGAVQGRKGGDEDTIKVATKALHGLRPKSLAVFVAQELARSLQVKALFGVGNAGHVFLSRNKRPVFFNYDELWEEHDGERCGEHWYRIPLKAKRRSGDEIKPNKRSLYAKRYALLDELSRQIKTALPSFPRQST